MEEQVYLLEGRGAYERGTPLESCPYKKPGSFGDKHESANAYDLWNQGWHQARQRAEGKLSYITRPLAFII